MFAKIFLISLIIGWTYSQNSSYGFGVESFPGVDCNRACKTAIPRVCYFKWHLELYTAMGLACGTCGKIGGFNKDCFNEQCVTADGIERGIMTINRQIPGPPIHVCKGDLIVVDVVNMMGGTAASIHWHGFHQRKTPHYDGVPFVTQCPIDYATTFRYAFWANEPGTQFYHSHSGHHKVNGQYGGIVVRENPKDDTNFKTYDVDSVEHLMVVSDWLDNLGEAFDPGMPSHPSGQVPRSFLINGKGTIHDKTTGKSTTGVPLALFKVARDKRYRFRLVNSMSLNCPAELSIEGHSLQVIASDSYDLQPVEVTSLVSLPGERYDFVVTSNQPGDTFWIRIKALGACSTRQVQQYAILSYKPSTESKVKLSYPSRPFPAYAATLNAVVKSLNDPKTKCGPGDLNNFCITDLSSYAYAPSITDVATVDHQFFLGFDMINQNVSDIFAPGKFENFNNPIADFVQVAVINKISFALPSFSPLTQTSDIGEGNFCNSSSLPLSCKGKEICYCTHLLKVKLNSIVELVIVDERPTPSPLNHPFHLHGFPLFVMGMGQDLEKPPTVASVKELSRQGRLSRTIGKLFPVKDTISIPSKGYTIFRFKADNPGFWLLHCHLEFHLGNGMGLILQVGEHHEMVKPPAGFPKCNNFVPNIDASIFNT